MCALQRFGNVFKKCSHFYGFTLMFVVRAGFDARLLNVLTVKHEDVRLLVIEPNNGVESWCRNRHSVVFLSKLKKESINRTPCAQGDKRGRFGEVEGRLLPQPITGVPVISHSSVKALKLFLAADAARCFGRCRESGRGNRLSAINALTVMPFLQAL